MAVPRSVRLALLASVAALAVGGLVQAVAGGAGAVLPLLGVVGVVAIEVALARDQRCSQRCVVASLVVLPFAVWGITAGQAGDVAWFVLVVVLAQVAFTEPVSFGAIGWSVAIGLIGALAGVEATLAGWVNWLAGISAGFWGAWVARHRIELIQRVNAAEATATAAASAVQRTQLAHDLHDVVAHTLAVTVLHLGGARLAVRDSPAEATAAIEEAERLARRSMEELRQVVRVLGQDGPHALASPQPGATDLIALVEEYKGAGLLLDLALRGDLARVGGPTGMVAFRVVQEALANASRHAPDQRAALDLTVDEHGGLWVCVTNTRGPRSSADTGAAAAAANFAAGQGEVDSTAGLGLVAMRQRVDAVGGKLEVGPVGEDWVVRAVLPA